MAGNIPVKSLPLKSAAPTAAATTAAASTAAATQGANIHFEEIIVDIDTVDLGGVLPVDFLGTSLEWGGVTSSYGQNPEVWAEMFSIFGKRLIIRVGGASQEKIKEVGWNAAAEGKVGVGKRCGGGWWRVYHAEFMSELSGPSEYSLA